MARPRSNARTVKETEIKLVTDSDSLAELKRNPNLRGRETSQSLVTTYFDTRDRRLAKAGVRLRLRTGHGRIEQTIKTHARDGPSFAVQLEKTCLLDRPKLDIKAFPKSNRESLETLAGGADLKKIASTKVERLRRTLECNGARIELAFDFGTIEAAGYSRNISELELELKRGNLATLLQFIRDLPPGFKLAWSSSSKCARAFDLADGLEMAASKAVPVSLKSDMPVRTAFQVIAWNCLGHLINNYLVVIEQRDAEAVHQCRVALRRLRAAASIFDRVIDERPGATLPAQWKAVAEPGLVNSASAIEPPVFGLMPGATEGISHDVEMMRAAAQEGGREAAWELFVTGELLTLGAGADRFESVADRGPAAPVSLLAEIPAVPAWPIDRERIDEAGARLKILTVSSTPPILIEAANSLAARLEHAERVFEVTSPFIPD